jgi:hypothetical protein
MSSLQIHLETARGLADRHPHLAAVELRTFIEVVVKETADEWKFTLRSKDLIGQIRELETRTDISPDLLDHFHTIRKLGNRVHANRPTITSIELKDALVCANKILLWCEGELPSKKPQDSSLSKSQTVPISYPPMDKREKETVVRLPETETSLFTLPQPAPRSYPPLYDPEKKTVVGRVAAKAPAAPRSKTKKNSRRGNLRDIVVFGPLVGAAYAVAKVSRLVQTAARKVAESEHKTPE